MASFRWLCACIPFGLLAGCRGLPADHAVQSWLGRSINAIANDIRAIPDATLTAVARTNRLAGSIKQLPAASTRRVGSLVRKTRAQLDRSIDRVARTPGAIRSRSQIVAQRFVTDVRRITDIDTLTLGQGDIGTALARRRSSIRRSFGHLGIDHWMPRDTTDIDRWPDVDPPPRRRTMIERMTDRIRL